MAGSDLPSIDDFGVRLVARARRDRRPWWRTLALGVAVALPVAATSGAATAVVLRQTVVTAPDPSQVPDEQTPLAGTAHVLALRAADPGGGSPWALRVARSKTGFTCTTVGQVQDGTFGLVGLDGVFRRLPAELSDSCGQGGTLTGARVLDADAHADVRSIVFGVAGANLRAATLTTARGDKPLKIGDGGTYLAALRGYPEDQTAGVTLRFASGRSEHHNFGAARDTIPDPGGGQAWTTTRYTVGTRFQCSQVHQARLGSPGLPTTPTVCLALRASNRAWVADARTFHPGEKGIHWQNAPARTVVWGIARSGKTLKAVTLNGRALTVSKQGAFAAVLPASVDPRTLTLDVTLADGTVQHGRPGDGIARRPR